MIVHYTTLEYLPHSVLKIPLKVSFLIFEEKKYDLQNLFFPFENFVNLFYCAYFISQFTI